MISIPVEGPVAGETPRAAPSQGRLGGLGRFLANPRALVGVVLVLGFVLVGALAPLLTSVSPNAELFDPLQSPSWQHLLGTTQTGEDVWSQLVWGTRASLEVGFAAGALATLLAALTGMLSGYLGGATDEGLQLLTNVFLVIPTLPLIVVIATYFPLQGDEGMILIIALTSWAWAGRILRSQVASMRTLAFVESAQMAGESRASIVFREIMPNMWSLVFANFLFAVVAAILTQAGLQFIGLGNLNQVSWGTMLYWAQNDGALLTGAWWWFVPPGLCIALFATGLAFVNYGIDEFTNPRLAQAARRRRPSARRAT
jgi:peptide/nickel transport system permease protein